MQCGLELVFPHLDEINKPETSPAILALPCWQRNGSADVSLTVLPPTLLPCLLVLFLGVQPAQEVSSEVANSSVWLLLCVNSENHSQLNKQHAVWVTFLGSTVGHLFRRWDSNWLLQPGLVRGPLWLLWASVKALVSSFPLSILPRISLQKNRVSILLSFLRIIIKCLGNPLDMLSCQFWKQ